MTKELKKKALLCLLYQNEYAERFDSVSVVAGRIFLSAEAAARFSEDPVETIDWDKSTKMEARLYRRQDNARARAQAERLRQARMV